MTNLFHYRTRIEIERRRRIMLAVWAYAYEIANPPQSLVSDHHFDAECRKVDGTIRTGHAILDDFFDNPGDAEDDGKFIPCTGQWIHWHPELDKVEKLYNRLYKGAMQ